MKIGAQRISSRDCGNFRLNAWKVNPNEPSIHAGQWKRNRNRNLCPQSMNKSDITALYDATCRLYLYFGILASQTQPIRAKTGRGRRACLHSCTRFRCWCDPACLYLAAAAATVDRCQIHRFGFVLVQQSVTRSGDQATRICLIWLLINCVNIDIPVVALRLASYFILLLTSELDCLWKREHIKYAIYVITIIK